MFSKSTYALVAALFAAIALFGSLATASAGEDTEATSTAAGGHRLPNIDPSLLPVDHPAYAVLQSLLESDLLPRQAADVLRRASDAYADRVAPGFACDRIAATDLASGDGTALRERCRTQLGDGANVFALCRRAVEADHVDPSIIERCRTLLDEHSDRNGDADRGTLAEACRRLASSDIANEELAKRCRNAFDGDDHSNDGALAEACRRLASSDIANEELAKRCRNAFDGQDHDPNPDAGCRRLAQSDVVSEELTKRCRNAFDGDDHDADPDAGCRRLAHSDVANEELAKRCRNAFDEGDTHDRPRTDLDGRSRPRLDADRATELRERFGALSATPRSAAR